MSAATVATMRCLTYEQAEVETALGAALDALGGWSRYIHPGERVLIKPNLLVGEPPERAVNTHPIVLRAAIRACLAAGATVTVGDSPGFGAPARNAARAGYLAVCEETGVEWVDMSIGQETPCPEGRSARRFLIAQPVLAADKVISLAKLKTHALVTYTGAVKNLYGVIAGIEKARLHLTYDHAARFSDMLLDLYSLIRPVLSIVDAVVGMEGAGPRSGTPRQVGLLLASDDGLAVDRIGAAIIGAPLRRVPYLARAAGRGLGVTELDQIEVVGVSLAEARIGDFRLPKNGSGHLAPPLIENVARRIATARPVVQTATCGGCGVCVKACPAGAIRLVEHKAHITDAECIRCYCCQEMCPEGAITLERGPLARLLGW